MLWLSALLWEWAVGPVKTAVWKRKLKAEDSSSQNKRRQLRDKSDYGKVIALTFDDGPNTEHNSLVLDKLEEHGIVASFFVIEQQSQTRVQSMEACLQHGL